LPKGHRTIKARKLQHNCTQRLWYSTNEEVIEMSGLARAGQRLIETLSLEERIRRRAYERYIARGDRPGSLQLDDWLQSEAEIRGAQERAIDEAGEESFPASDSPAL
jgi:hypothetical protein